MDREEAKKLISKLTYCEKLMLRDLLSSKQHNREAEQAHQELDQNTREAS